MKKTFFLIAILSGVFFLNESCKVEDPTYPFRIRVINAQDEPVDSAFVIVRPNVANPVKQALFENYTNMAGEVNFQYDREAIFIVQATIADINGMQIGCEYIRLQPEGEAFVEVKIEPTTLADDSCF